MFLICLLSVGLIAIGAVRKVSEELVSLPILVEQKEIVNRNYLRLTGLS